MRQAIVFNFVFTIIFVVMVCVSIVFIKRILLTLLYGLFSLETLVTGNGGGRLHEVVKLNLAPSIRGVWGREKDQ